MSVVPVQLLISLLFLGGCLWTPRSSLTLPHAATQILPQRIELSPWWETFHDRQLNKLTESALAKNLEIKQATARIRQAQAAARKSGAALFPTLDGQADIRTNQADEDRLRSAELGALLRWEIDLWGRLRLGRQAAQEDLAAAQADALSVRVLLTTALAETYLTILEEAQQQALLQRQVATNQTLLDLTQLRFGQGLASIVDVLQQREQLTSTKALVPLTEAASANAHSRLAVLLGQSPEQALASHNNSFPNLPKGGTISTKRLLKRPDMVARQHRLLALDHEVGQAIADRLPQVTLSASSGLSDSTNLSALVTSAVAEMVTPLFDTGARRAEVDRRRAVLEEALHEYGQAYLQAAEELQIALVNEQTQQQHLALLRNELNTAHRLLNEARNRYSQGLTDYLPVLDSVEQAQELERSLITNERLLLSYRVQRHRALGGS